MEHAKFDIPEGAEPIYDVNGTSGLQEMMEGIEQVGPHHTFSLLVLRLTLRTRVRAPVRACVKPSLIMATVCVPVYMYVHLAVAGSRKCTR